MKLYIYREIESGKRGGGRRRERERKEGRKSKEVGREREKKSKEGKKERIIE